MKLNYKEQGSGAPLILMHGMFGSLSNLGNLARALADDYRVISVDLRNHGDSPHEQRMDLEAMGLDIIELMDQLCIESAALIGHSLGGKVAMQVAMNYPARVACMVVADISPVTYPQQTNSPVINALEHLAKETVNSRQEADALLTGYQIDTPTKAFLLKNLYRLSTGLYGLKLNVDSIASNYGNNLVRAPEGQSYAGPTLFVKGQNSAYIQDKHRPIIDALFPHSQLEIIDGVGHWLHAEKPQVFNSLVSGFLTANI
jgi:esterase